MSSTMIARLALAAALAVLTGCGGAGTAPNPPADDAGTGDPRPSNVTVTEDRMDFGFVDCGGAPSLERSVKITNSGGSSFSWTAELEAPGFSIVGASNGTFTGSGVVNVKVRANPFPSNVDAGTVNRATLIINIDKTKIFRTPLVSTAQGGTITVAPGQAVFGEISMNTQAPDLPLDIKNTGNKSVTISFEQPSAVDFGIAYTGKPAGIELAPGASLPGAAGRFRPTRLVQQTTAAPIKVTGAVCGASAKSITMIGKGTGGVVGVSPGELDYGKVNCGTTANFQVLTLLNSGTAPFTFNLTLADGAASSFVISPSSGTVLAGSQQGIFITPKAIPSTSAITDNLYGDILTVTTDAANDTPHDVALKMGARGAILAFTATPNDYGTRNMFSAALNQNVTVTNSGNIPANVTLTKGTSSFTVGALGTIAGPGNGTTTVGFSPAAFGDISDSLSISTSAVLCQGLPGAASLTGKGKGVATQVSVGGLQRVRVDQNTREEADSTCALLTGGRVACWGAGTYGQLGNGASQSSATPVVVSTLTNATAVAAGGSHNCARTALGQAYCWGGNFSGQLGTAGGSRNTPTLVAGVANVISIAAGYGHTCVVAAAAAGGTSGKVYCWGKRGNGALGDAQQTRNGLGSATPIEVAGITDATQVTVHGPGGCARRATSVVSCWGNNNRGELGNNTSSYGSFSAAQVVNLSNATMVAAGSPRDIYEGGVLALQSTGGVVCWGGGGRRGMCGPFKPGFPSTQSSPLGIAEIAGATAVTRGAKHGCALIGGAGTIKCFGINDQGQLGNAGAGNQSLAVDVTGVTGAVGVSAGGFSTCAVLNTAGGGSGAVTCWGSNSQGQLGNPAAGGAAAMVVSGF